MKPPTSFKWTQPNHENRSEATLSTQQHHQSLVDTVAIHSCPFRTTWREALSLARNPRAKPSVGAAPPRCEKPRNIFWNVSDAISFEVSPCPIEAIQIASTTGYQKLPSFSACTHTAELLRGYFYLLIKRPQTPSLPAVDQSFNFFQMCTFENDTFDCVNKLWDDPGHGKRPRWNYLFLIVKGDAVLNASVQSASTQPCRGIPDALVKKRIFVSMRGTAYVTPSQADHQPQPIFWLVDVAINWCRGWIFGNKN